METTIMRLYLRNYRDAPMFFFMSRDKNAGLYGVYRTLSIYRRVKPWETTRVNQTIMQ